MLTGKPHPILRTTRYILGRILAILLTLVIGVFITVIVANLGGMVDAIAQKQVDLEIRQLMRRGIFDSEEIDHLREELEYQSGLTLPFWQRHLRYTFKALTLDWGEVADRRKFSIYLQNRSGDIVKTEDSRTIILSKLPNSLLLSGTAYLLLVLISLPLALYLSQREGTRFDRLISLLTPISSVPSWVIGVLLVMFFAVEIRLFPVAKMYDGLPPTTRWETIRVVGYHMILPVTAIILSLAFQLIYNWRTYLMIYSDEDYVELAKAKGLKRAALESRYILRPGLPYLLTGFTLTLVGFWQSITALEFFFQWPGIGKLYVDALPNFHGENMYPGEMSLVIGIVVLFAYLLGLTVFLLDIAYVIIDPRLRVDGRAQTSQLSPAQIRSRSIRHLRELFKPKPRPQPLLSTTKDSRKVAHDPRRIQHLIPGLKYGCQDAYRGLKRVFVEIWRSPAAVVGLVVVSGLVLGSIFVAVFLPYKTIGRQWATSTLSSNPSTAKLALPEWVNWFRSEDLPSTIILDTQNDRSFKRVTYDPAGLPQVQIDFNFDYPYLDFPSETVIYLTSEYISKIPFATLSWFTPDGREFHLKNTRVAADQSYSFNDSISSRRILEEYKTWQKWFVPTGNFSTPPFYLLFADPQSEEPQALPGEYTLRITGTLFEETGDLDAQLVVFGLVEGWAGTDNLRRDLGVPLLWGLPFALMIGGIGAVVTTLASLIIAAAGVWLGGWVDGLIQRVIEANLILPVIAIGVLFYAFYGFNLWLVLGFLILLNIFGSPTKSFRAALLQVKESSYIEAARAYGAGNFRIIRHYLIPRIMPVVIPQIVTLIPNFVFLEATLAILNIYDPRYPTWGNVIYSALRYGAAYGSRFWVLEPIALLLLTGVAFVLLGFALNRIFNTRLTNV